jgi:hypothetical protein
MCSNLSKNEFTTTTIAYIDTPFGLLCIHINQIRRLVGVKFLELLRKQWSLYCLIMAQNFWNSFVIMAMVQSLCKACPDYTIINQVGLFLEAVFKLRTQCIILPYKLLASGATGTTNASMLDPQHMQSPNCKNCKAQ